MSYYQYDAKKEGEISDKTSLLRYFRKELGWGKGFQSDTVFNFLFAASRFCRGGVILDAGAGHQRYRPFFKNSLYLSQEHEKGVAFKEMKTLKYDILKPVDEIIPLKDGCLDGVLSTSVMEHLLHPDVFCREAYRVLKPGGKVFINVPFSIIEHERPFDYNRPTRYALRKWLENAGFSAITVKPSSSCTDTVSRVLPITVYCDILQTDQGYEKNFADVSRMEKPFYFKLARYLRILYAALMYVLTLSTSRVLRVIVDRGPYNKALLPVGWVAIATKGGKIKRYSSVPEKDKFLKKFRI